MKKLLRALSLLLLFTFILTSCGKGMYITKRKYTKGFYVNRSHKKENLKDQATRKALKQDAPQQTLLVKAKTKTPEVQKQEVVTAQVVAPAEPAVSLNGSLSKKQAPVLTSRAQQVKLLGALIPDKKMSEALKQKLTRDSDALSLLWIIILVILLVYLIGLLFDSFGLGWVIHILALVALILLILWLLRIL